MRLFRGEGIEDLARETGVTVSEINRWRESFLAGELLPPRLRELWIWTFRGAVFALAVVGAVAGGAHISPTLWIVAADMSAGFSAFMALGALRRRHGYPRARLPATWMEPPFKLVGGAAGVAPVVVAASGAPAAAVLFSFVAASVVADFIVFVTLVTAGLVRQ